MNFKHESRDDLLVIHLISDVIDDLCHLLDFFCGLVVSGPVDGAQDDVLKVGVYCVLMDLGKLENNKEKLLRKLL